MKLSVHRALTRLKTLDAQIKERTSTSCFIAVVKGDKKLVMTPQLRMSSFEDASKTITANFNSVKDLIAERQKIKSAIIQSNALTKITVGTKELTVAEAIEYKNSMAYEQQLLSKLRIDYASASQLFDRQTQSVETEIQQLVAAMVSRETNTKVTDEQLDIARKTVETRNKPELIDPLKIVEKISAMADELQHFIDEVDAVLSESNARTEIEIA